MRLLIGCSGAIALVAFLVGLAASLFVSEATWTQRLGIAAMPAAIAFVAAFLLASRDSARQSTALGAVRRQLLAGIDTSEECFLSSRPCDDPSLLLETRLAIARFFDVPTTKVGRYVHLVRDLQVDKLEPSFQFNVVDSVIASQAVKPKRFGFSIAGLETLDDLADAIRKVLDEFDAAWE